MRKLRPLAVLALTLALAGCANLRDWSEIFENINRTLVPLTVLIKSSEAPPPAPARNWGQTPFLAKERKMESDPIFVPLKRIAARAAP